MPYKAIEQRDIQTLLIFFLKIRTGSLLSQYPIYPHCDILPETHRVAQILRLRNPNCHEPVRPGQCYGASERTIWHVSKRKK